MRKILGLALMIAVVATFSLVPMLGQAHPPSVTSQDVVHCHAAPGSGDGSLYVKPPLLPLTVGIHGDTANPTGIRPYVDTTLPVPAPIKHSNTDHHAGQPACDGIPNP